MCDLAMADVKKKAGIRQPSFAGSSVANLETKNKKEYMLKAAKVLLQK